MLESTVSFVVENASLEEKIEVSSVYFSSPAQRVRGLLRWKYLFI